MNTNDLSNNENIIDTFENKNCDCCEIKDKEYKKLLDKFNNTDISKYERRINDFIHEQDILKEDNERLTNENIVLRNRLSEINYNIDSDNSDTDYLQKSFSFKEDDDLICQDKKYIDITSYSPFKLLTQLIALINEVKNLLKKLSNGVNEFQHNININEQESDDILFYRSIISDSRNFFITSFKIRKNKILFDINNILAMFDYEYIPTVSELNKTTYNILKKYYQKLGKEVEENNKNIGKPTWIKNNRLKYIETIKREMNRTFIYHIQINEYYRNNIIGELKFFKIK